LAFASAAAIAAHANGVVVGSAVIEALRASLDRHGKATEKSVEAVAGLVADIAKGARSAAAAPG